METKTKRLQRQQINAALLNGLLKTVLFLSDCEIWIKTDFGCRFFFSMTNNNKPGNLVPVKTINQERKRNSDTSKYV